ncbi:MAG: multicopper oxidase domain-containing protein [Deferrisomatales bacterium]
MAGTAFGAAPGLPRAAGAVAAPAGTTAVLVDEVGAATSQAVAADGRFAVSVPSGHTYVLVLRQGRRTLGVLVADAASGRNGFYLAHASPNLSLGAVTIDTVAGKALSGLTLPLAAHALADADEDGFPDVAGVAVFPLRDSNIPSGAPATPTFGAQPFTQLMIRFEEFGTNPMPTEAAAEWTSLPKPKNFRSGPDGPALDAFLAQDGVFPFPTRLSNIMEANPWNPEIQAYLGRTLIGVGDGVPGPAEGRPSGEGWAHQYWDELPAQRYFKTTVSPARVNNGFRDDRQRHGYALGEFGPGPDGQSGTADDGLYHTVFTWAGGAPTLRGSTAGLPIALHPLMPVQDPNSVWTFDGNLPPRLLQVRVGESTMMRNYDTLPIDETANHPFLLDTSMVTNGFGRHTISTHDHNGHQAAETDGGPFGFYFPGQYWDYLWSLQLAGFSNNNNAAGAINYDASDPRAAIPCEAGETFNVLVNGVPTERACADPDGDGHGAVMIPGDWRETMSTHWFHDHMFDHTSENVYKGNATMMDYFSAIDRGNEAIDDGVNLRLPSGTALSWGNRDYDVHLLVADKATDQNGQLWFNTEERDGFLGDVMTVNWLYKPYFDVRARKYRFRFLNGGVARVLKIGLVQEVNGAGGELPGPAGSNVSYNRVPFHMIANDGNIMGHAIPFDGVRDVFHDKKPDAWKGQLPAQTVAERYDIVVDFSQFEPGTKLYFVNAMEHQNGRGSRATISMADIVSGAYNPVVESGRWTNGDPCVTKFLELRVHALAEGQVDLSMNPADYEPGKKQMIPLPLDRLARTVNGVSLDTARHRTMEFVRAQGGSHAPWQIKVDGGPANVADEHRISAILNGEVEVWTIKGGRGWTHPVHIHFEEGMILTRGGKLPPDWELYARKDMYRIGPEEESSGEMEIVYRARDFLGDYVLHCHNTTHEDYAMLLRWDAQAHGLALADAPLPTFDGVFFEPSYALPTAETGDGVGPERDIPVP